MYKFANYKTSKEDKIVLEGQQNDSKYNQTVLNKSFSCTFINEI